MEQQEKLEELRRWFRTQGITQVMIADRLGISKPYVNQLLNGSIVFTYKSAQKWKEIFGISDTWLVTGKGRMMDENFTATPSASVVAVPSTPQSVSQETFEQILQKKDWSVIDRANRKVLDLVRIKKRGCRIMATSQKHYEDGTHGVEIVC